MSILDNMLSGEVRTGAAACCMSKAPPNEARELGASWRFTSVSTFVPSFLQRPHSQKSRLTTAIFGLFRGQFIFTERRSLDFPFFLEWGVKKL